MDVRLTFSMCFNPQKYDCLRKGLSLWTHLVGKVTLNDTIKKEYHKSRQIDKCKRKNLQEKKQRQTKVEWLHRLFSEAQ